jgi:hypothetical protein
MELPFALTNENKSVFVKRRRLKRKQIKQFLVLNLKPAGIRIFFVNIRKPSISQVA